MRTPIRISMKKTFSKQLFTLLFIIVAISHANGQKKEPWFKTNEDSVHYYQIMSQFQSLRQQSQKVNYDSLFQLMKSLVAGYKTIYYPSEDFNAFEKVFESSRPDTFSAIFLEGKKFIKIPKQLKACKSLKQLELVNTSVKKIPRWLNNNKALEELTISNNQPYNDKALNLQRNRRIKKLKINGISERHVAKSLARFKGLQQMLYYDCKFNHLPRRLHKNKKLYELRFTQCQFEAQPIFKGKSKAKAQKLVFNECGLANVPKNIGKFKYLKNLQFAKNNIDSIPLEITQLKNLKCLSFYSNKIKVLPKELCQLNQLQELDLYHNEISKVHKEIAQLHNLKVLYLSHNKLYSLPEEIGQLTQLNYLYIHHNKLSHLPETIKGLHSLQVFHFNNNYFQDFPLQVLDLPDLIELNIASNDFLTLPLDKFQYMKLKNLYIFHNPLEEEFLASPLFKEYIHKLEIRGINVKY